MPPRLLGLLLICCVLAPAARAAEPAQAGSLARTVATLKPSVVGIGTFQKTRSPAVRFVGTGFAVGDGGQVVTNAHVLPAVLDGARLEQLGIVIAAGERVEFRPAKVVASDREHDLALLSFEGAPLSPLALGEETLAEGSELAFTGFPLGMVLGLHHATHRALLAAVTPIVLPSLSSGKLGAGAIVQLQRAAFPIYQLDATAYPGNSGSPVYDPASGVVHGVLNMVFVKGLKETAITTPSGITYAIPVRHVRELMQRKKSGAK